MIYKYNNIMQPCKFFHDNSCRAYKQGFCKFGGNCRFRHVANLLVLPVDVLMIIFDQIYLSDLLPVNKSLNNIISFYYPLKLYIFTGIMNGGYTNGNALATARCKNDAIYRIAIRVVDNQNPKCNFGLWDQYGSYKIRKYEEIDPLTLIETTSCFASFVSKYRKDILFRNFRRKNARNKVKEAQISICNIYFELLREKSHSFSSGPTLTILPLDRSIGFFNGGGS